MSGVLCIGIDPGPTPGVVALHTFNGVLVEYEVAQVSAGLISLLLKAVATDSSCNCTSVLIQVERFVVSKRSGRSSTAGAGAITRDMVGIVTQVAAELGAVCVQRNASQVKAWATDERLKLAGIEIPKGMTHARDSARHGLFAAVHAGYLPDPYSQRSKR